MNSDPRTKVHSTFISPRSVWGLITITVILLALFIILSIGASAEEWSGERSISNADKYAGSPAVGIDGEDNVYVLWEEGRGVLDEQRILHLMKMSPRGEVLFNYTLWGAITLDSSWPDIAVEKDGTAHIVWQDSNPGNRNIFYMALDPDGEKMFKDPVAIVQGSLGMYTPSIAVDSLGHVHIAWLDFRPHDIIPDYEIYYTELDPSLAEGRGGDVEDADIRLIDDTMISSGLMIFDIFNFYEFLTGFQVLEYPPFPNVAVNSRDEVHVIWTDGRDGNPEIYYSVLDPSLASRDGGSSNLSALSIVNNSRLTWGPSLSLQPMIAIGPDDAVHIAFTDNLTDSFEVYYATIDHGAPGINESLEQISTSNGEPSGLSPIAVDREGNIYISWRDMCCDHFEVFLSKLSPARDRIWDNQRISHCDSTAGNPPIVIDSNLNPIIFWQDNRTSTYQIYYNRTVMFPDLSIHSTDITSDAMDGSDSHLYINVRNTGNRDILAPIEIIIEGETWVSTVEIKAGETKTIPFAWNPLQGDYSIDVLLDPQHTIIETDETNNAGSTLLHVPYPPRLGMSRAELFHNNQSHEVSEGKEIEMPADTDICWLDLSLYNSGGSGTGTITILVTGELQPDGSGGHMDPILLTTQVNMNASSQENISFILEPILGRWNYQLILDSGHALDGSWKDTTVMNFSIVFLTPPDPAVSGIVIRGDRTEGESLDIIVDLSNSGSLPATGTLTLSIDSIIQETRRLTLESGTEHRETFSWEAARGEHEITVYLDVIPDGDPGNNLANLTVTIAPDEGLEIKPIIIAGTIVAVLTAVLLAFTEGGRYHVLRFLVVPIYPLYTRIKRGKVLDHFMRGQVYGFIRANPGAHYNLIRRKLDINNGALAYHIAVLEREKFIRSRMDGTLKRFYPSDMNIPKDHELTEMERRLIDVVRANPGFSQKEIALTLGLSPQVVNYHIKSLARNHVLRLTRVGKRTMCYLSEGVEFDS